MTSFSGLCFKKNFFKQDNQADPGQQFSCLKYSKFHKKLKKAQIEKHNINAAVS